MGQLPTLTFKPHHELASAKRARTLLFMYMMWASASACARVWVFDMCSDWMWRSDGLKHTAHTVWEFWVSWLGFEYGGVGPEGSVTLGQGDRSGQVCVHPCVSALCQDSRWQVKGHQWPSPYFSLGVIEGDEQSTNASHPVVSLNKTSHGHVGEMNTYTDKRAIGLFMN